MEMPGASQATASQSDMEQDVQNERKVKALKQNIEEEKQVKL